MSGSKESTDESATESQDDDEENGGAASGEDDEGGDSGGEDDEGGGEEGGGGGENDAEVQLSEQLEGLLLSANICEHSELIECWKKQNSCCSIKIDKGKKYEGKNGKWLTGDKIDMKKVLSNLDAYINEKKEKSNAYDELRKLVAILQKEAKIEKSDKRVMSSKIKTIGDTLSWGKREEKAYQELEKVIGKFKKRVLKLKLEGFPLSMEILDELQKKVKQSDSTILEAEENTANKFPNVSKEESELYSFEIDKDCPMVKVSIPSKYGKDEFKDVLKKHDRQIFIPSYMRANCALLDWKKAIVVPLDKTLQILVVRPSQFKKYLEWHGGRIPIVSLPNNVIGIGYARHWILKIASYFGLRFIWMMDDSIKRFSDYDKNGKYVGRLRFEYVFSQIERFVKETKGLAAMSPVIFRPQTPPKTPPPAFLRRPPRAVVCLDLELINDKKVSYRPELKSFEDMLFGAECEREGLKVVMCNRIRASDLQFKHTGVHSPYQTGQDSKETGGLKTGMN